MSFSGLMAYFVVFLKFLEVKLPYKTTKEAGPCSARS